jgi:hypothetical protein
MLSTPTNLRTIANQDGAAILDVSSNQITTLNSTGSFIWTRLQEGSTVQEIVHQIASTSDAEITLVEREVNAFVDDLRAHSLLITSPTH